MSQPRYERLSSSGQDDKRIRKHPSAPTSKRSNKIYEEEIELDTDEYNLKIDKDEANYKTNSPGTTTTPNANAYPAATAGQHYQLLGTRFMQLAIGTLATILLYLTLSISLTFYQKALIKKLKFPLCIVAYHLVIKFLLAALVRLLYRCHFGKTRVQLDLRTAVRKIGPTGIASGIDIGFSNWGLELVPISLYTMTKSSTIVFILFFAILLGLEKKSWSLVFIVSLIATGLFMFTYKSTQFDALGFVFILMASLSSGVRWSLAQFVMQKTKLGLHNPIDMIYHMQPWMILSILPFLSAFEGQKLYDILRDLDHTYNEVILMVAFKITFGAVLAFFMEVSEFLVLSKTSSLTLSIAGIFKDICQLALAVELNDDQLSLMNVLGLIVCLAGISCHVIHKYLTLEKIEELGSLCEETNVAVSSGKGSSNHNISPCDPQDKHSAQNIPLLEHTDSEDSIRDNNERDASEVIFDVLKRRDIVM